MRNPVNVVAFRLNRGIPRALSLAVTGLMMVQIVGCDSREEQLVDVHSERAEAGEAEEERAKDIAEEREKEPANHKPLVTPQTPKTGTAPAGQPATPTKPAPGSTNLQTGAEAEGRTHGAAPAEPQR